MTLSIYVKVSEGRSFKQLLGLIFKKKHCIQATIGSCDSCHNNKENLVRQQLSSIHGLIYFLAHRT